jgi:hypothetical protein
MVVATALLTAGLVVGLAVAAEDRWERPDWKGVAAYLEERTTPDVPIVLGSQFGSPGTGDRVLFLQSLSVYMDDANLMGLGVADTRGFDSIEPSPEVWVAVQSVIGGVKPGAPEVGPGFELVSKRFFKGFQRIGVFRYRREPSGPFAGATLESRDGRAVLDVPGQAERPVTSGSGFVEGVRVFEDRLWVAGWAADDRTERVPRTVLLFHDGRFLGVARPALKRPDVAQSLGPGALRSGYRVEVFTGRASRLGRVERLEVVAVSGDRAWKLSALDGLRVQEGL